MTAVEHIIAWIESSRAHYDRLCRLERQRKVLGPRSNRTLASEAFLIAADAYDDMIHGGDAYAENHSPATILDAAKALLEWELEQ